MLAGGRIGGAMLKTLFLNPPSFDGFDGGAGARYQAKREIRSFWYPTWLAQPAAASNTASRAAPRARLPGFPPTTRFMPMLKDLTKDIHRTGADFAYHTRCAGRI